jgi:hypothetical protein
MSLSPQDDAPLSVWRAWLHYLSNLPGWSTALERDIQYAMKLIQEEDDVKPARGLKCDSGTNQDLAMIRSH